MMKGTKIMRNIEISVTEEDVLLIKIDLHENVGLTKSERNVTIGTTGGNVPVWTPNGPHPTGARVNCSVFRPLLPEEKKTLEAERVTFAGMFT